MLKIFLSILLCCFLSISVYAQQDTPLSEVKASEIELLNEQEKQRTQEIANLLGFVLPTYTDNPSYIITFKDPSTNETGVEIDIDDKGFSKINSPYTLPALSIGKHEVRFRFNDESDTVKILEYELIVIPRAPIIDTPQVTTKSITISGTALANSDIIYLLSANAYHSTGTVVSDAGGKWSITIDSEQEFLDGIYTFTTLARKYGFASNLSSPITFTVGEGKIDSKPQIVINDGISFSFKDINMENISEILKGNTDLIFFSVGTLIIGGALGAVIKSVVYNSKSEKKNKEVEKLIKKEEKKEDAKTLREIFGDKEETEEPTLINEEPETTTVEEPQKQESIINKDVFLKKYKMVDPDDEKGVEKKKKKKVKISLTSKD